ELGPHPDDKEPVQIFDGRYGAYVKHGKVNATLPKGTDPQGFTLQEALPLLAERAARGPATKKSRGRSTTEGAAKAPQKAVKKAPKKKKKADS
ncbi:topoisomerase C-terminal repeat-containing protein, partial [Schlesneria sp.]|uniref:topoisomerase C-terminal repeat-containing protein n=1 Tax=Schlesneria sp. TaxID=2762018 RepID=UPI002EE66548